MPSILKALPGAGLWGWSSGEQYYYDPVFGVIDVMPEVFLQDEIAKEYRSWPPCTMGSYSCVAATNFPTYGGRSTMRAARLWRTSYRGSRYDGT
jgi:hypothetical protein